MQQGLFRGEALAAKRSSWLGRVSVVQPFRTWMLTLFAVLAAMSVAAFMAMGSYTRRVRVTGQLVPRAGIASVVAPTSGVITSVARSEGEMARRGEVLAEVLVPRATGLHASVQTALAQTLSQKKESLISANGAEIAQLRAQATGTRAQLRNARIELEQIQGQIETQERLAGLASATLERFQTLQKQGFVSQLQVNEQQASTLAQLAEIQGSKRQAASLRREIAQLEQIRMELPAQEQHVNAGLGEQLASLSQESVQLESESKQVVLAPVDGLIASQLAKAGQAVGAGQPLFSVLPSNGRLEADLFVPSRSVGFIRRGDRVLLRYQAFPYQKFGHQTGRVLTVSRNALNAEEIRALIGSSAFNEPVYRVTVSLPKQSIFAAGRNELLRPGMLLDADILSESRRLYEWACEPLFSLNSTVANR